MARKDELIEDEDEIEIEEEEEESSGLPKWLPVAVVVVAISGFGGLAWMAFDSSSKKVTYSEVPLIKAESGSIKEKPTDPGGMKIPHQDKEIYEAASGRTDATKDAIKAGKQPEEAIETGSQVVTQEQPSHERSALIEDPKEKSKRVEKIASADETKPATVVTAENKNESVEVSEQAQLQEKPANSAEESAARIASAGKKADEIKAPVKIIKMATNQKKEEIAKPQERITAQTSDKLAVQAKEVDMKSEAVAAAKSQVAGTKIQLGAFRSEAEAVGAWKKVLGGNKDVLSKKVFTIQKAEVPGKGVFYRLQVGGFKSADDASGTCKSLSARKTNCFVVR